MSKYEQYSRESYVFPHKHCPVCNKMIEETETYCSEECAGSIKQKGKKQKRQIFIVVGVYAIVIIAFILVMIFLQ